MRDLVSHIARAAAPLLALVAFLSMPAIAYAQAGPFQCKTPATPEKPRVLFDDLSSDSKKVVLSGHVVVNCDGTSIYADKIEWDDKTVVATGDVLVIQDGLRVNAERVEMDRQTKMGIFYQAVGTARLTNAEAQKPMFGEMEPEIMFFAEKLERIGQKTYKLTNGMFSTCVQPNPRWQMTGSSGTVVLDEHAVMKNLALKVKGVPVMYLPYLYVPLKKEKRATGFLIPQYSTSGVEGWGLSNAFFLVLGRSQDATFYYDWRSKGFQQGGVEYRYVATQSSGGNARYFLTDEQDRFASDGTLERAGRRSYRVDGDIRQRLPNGFTLHGFTNFQSDITTQQLYQQNLFEQSRRDRNIVVQVNGNLTTRLRLMATAEQRDWFTGVGIARRSALPRADLWFAGKRLQEKGPLDKVYFGASGQAAYIDDRPNLEDPSRDRSLFRMDASSSLQAPLSNKDWLAVNSRMDWRITNWSESLDPATQQPVPIALTRNLLTFHGDVKGPLLERDFLTPNNGYAEKFKHVIEPSVAVDYLTPFNELNRVIKLDSNIDSLVGGTASISYSLVNRLWAKVRGPNDTSERREILSAGISQTWYSNAQAGAIDPNYPVPRATSFSALSFIVASSPFDDLRGQFRMYVNQQTRRVESYRAAADFSPRGGERFRIAGGWSLRPLQANLTTPSIVSHYVDAESTVRLLRGRIEATYGFNYDIKNASLLQQRIRAYYGAQCCGLAVDYQVLNIAQYSLENTARDRRLSVTFSLAGLGAFTAPLGAFGR